MNSEYKPFSFYHHLELIHQCFNRDCNNETKTFLDIDLTKHCKICNDKSNQTYQMQTYFNKKHIGFEDWEQYRGLEILKICKKCENKEKKSYAFSVLQIGKSCNKCGTVSPLIYVRFIDNFLKMYIPVIRYGRFECEPCKRTWVTFHIFWGCKHQCKLCYSLIYPVDVSVEYFNPVNFKQYEQPKIENIENNHNSVLCEKCAVKGQPCYKMSKEEIQEITKKLEGVKKKYIDQIIQFEEIKKREKLELLKANDLINKKVTIEIELEKEKGIEDKILLK